MKFLTLDLIKQHSRIDFNYDDDLLTLYGDAAEDTVFNILNRNYDEIMEKYGKVPTALKQAALMLVDNSYQYRSPVTVGNISMVPYAFDALLKPYMKLTTTTSN